MLSGWENLRLVREKLALTMRDVETASERIARHRNNGEYLIPISRLSDFETKGVIPSIYRLYSLAAIYRRDLGEMLAWYGVDPEVSLFDLEAAAPAASHLTPALANVNQVQIPVRMDPGFDPRQTLNLGRMVEQWGAVPFVYLERLSKLEFTYGYIGTEDLTMYPILLPGTFIQVDESRNRVTRWGWRSEYERPIYFVETREGHTCCWCTLGQDKIILQSHPLSPVPPKVVPNSEVDIVGQVVGVAMRLGDSHEFTHDAANIRKTGHH
jgi:hypothetical protein